MVMLPYPSPTPAAAFRRISSNVSSNRSSRPSRPANAEVGQFATDALADLGYTTRLVGSAAHALEDLAAGADRFDVVFTDVVMPGMTGIELAQEIRGRHADMPVVLTSGYSHVLSEHGSYGFELLQKPYSVEQLSRVLQRVGRLRKARRGNEVM